MKIASLKLTTNLIGQPQVTVFEEKSWWRKLLDLPPRCVVLVEAIDPVTEKKIWVDAITRKQVDVKILEEM